MFFRIWSELGAVPADVARRPLRNLLVRRAFVQNGLGVWMVGTGRGDRGGEGAS